MPRQLKELLADFDALNSADYDFRLGNFAGRERVRELCDELLAAPDAEQAIPTLFAAFERLPEADFGAPGALVHTIEKLSGYEAELSKSLRRKPTYYTVWMLNRILNGCDETNSTREFWLKQLQAAAVHPLADEAAQDEAREFLNFQSEE